MLRLFIVDHYYYDCAGCFFVLKNGRIVTAQVVDNKFDGDYVCGVYKIVLRLPIKCCGVCNSETCRLKTYLNYLVLFCVVQQDMRKLRAGNFMAIVCLVYGNFCWPMKHGGSCRVGEVVDIKRNDYFCCIANNKYFAFTDTTCAEVSGQNLWTDSSMIILFRACVRCFLRWPI